MGKKESPVAEPAEVAVEPAFRHVGKPLVVTPKDRIAFANLLTMTGLGLYRTKIAYFSVDSYGIGVSGMKLPYDHVPWSEEM